MAVRLAHLAQRDVGGSHQDGVRVGSVSISGVQVQLQPAVNSVTMRLSHLAQHDVSDGHQDGCDRVRDQVTEDHLGDRKQQGASGIRWEGASIYGTRVLRHPSGKEHPYGGSVNMASYPTITWPWALSYTIDLLGPRAVCPARQI